MIIAADICCCTSGRAYNQLSARRINITGSGASQQSTNILSGDVGAPPTGRFDFVNQNYYLFNSLNTKILQSDNECSIKNIVLTMSGNYKLHEAVSPNPYNSYIFYAARDDIADNTKVELRRVNYDGTGDISILTRSSGVVGPRILDIIVSKVEGYVFYTERWTGPTHRNIRRCNLDGSGDILIWDGSAVGDAFRLAIDNTNKVLFWSATIAGTTATIYKSAFDGTGATQILNCYTSSPPFPGHDSSSASDYSVYVMGWSHKNSKLYLSAFQTTALTPVTRYNGLGAYSCATDGTGLQQEVVYPNTFIDGSNVPSQIPVGGPWTMGDAYEVVGAATLAS